MQGGPRLLANGAAVPGLRDVNSSSRRAGVCLDKDNRLIFFCVSSSLSGVSLAELQTALRAPGIDCVDALNLDGGGSAQLYVSSELPGSVREASELSIRGKDEIPVALGLFLKK